MMRKILLGIVFILLTGCSLVQYSPQTIMLNTDKANAEVSIETKSHNIEEHKDYEHEYTKITDGSDTTKHHYNDDSVHNDDGQH